MPIWAQMQALMLERVVGKRKGEEQRHDKDTSSRTAPISTGYLANVKLCTPRPFTHTIWSVLGDVLAETELDSTVDNDAGYFHGVIITLL